jgi:hypothetical protein
MRERIALLERMNAMRQDIIEILESRQARIALLDAVAEAAAATLCYADWQYKTIWDNLESALRAAGYLKDGPS